STRSPHPRGDGPLYAETRAMPLMFSPPAWGWSGIFGPAPAGLCVLPTRVGMVRSHPSSGLLRSSSPHPRGDGPPSPDVRRAVVPFSPPAWGWSVSEHFLDVDGSVLPTRVGMVRSAGSFRDYRSGSPHPRGDGPAE